MDHPPKAKATARPQTVSRAEYFRRYMTLRDGEAPLRRISPANTPNMAVTTIVMVATPPSARCAVVRKFVSNQRAHIHCLSMSGFTPSGAPGATAKRIRAHIPSSMAAATMILVRRPNQRYRNADMPHAMPIRPITLHTRNVCQSN